MYTRVVIILMFLVSTATIYPATSWAAGSGGGEGALSGADDSTKLTLEQQAQKALAAGIRHRDRALKHEARAGEASSDTKRQKSLARAQTEFRKAVQKQSEALRLDPGNYKAANELGYALRKTGDFRKAIGAYNYALEINPDFHQATEYRGEAYLALGYFEHAQKSYMRLFRKDRALANQLMDAFTTWLNDRGGDLSESEVTFIGWVKERKRLASLTQDLSINNSRSW